MTHFNTTRSRELTTNNPPKTAVTVKISLSTPLKDLYMEKELLSPDESPVLFDWIRTKNTSDTDKKSCIILLIANKFIVL
jgi:hypothetical protein